jgi:uncharacterized damage-inducible protein DinB
MDDSSQPLIVEFIRYNNWANQQVLAACQNLNQEQLAAALPGAYGTIRDTLEHIIRGEARYVELLTRDFPAPSFKWEEKPDLAEMVAYATQIGDALLEAVQRVGPADTVYEVSPEQTVQYQALAIMIQIINHGVEHRTNITTILNQGLLTPPEVDGWAYLWSHRERFDLK